MSRDAFPWRFRRRRPRRPTDEARTLRRRLLIFRSVVILAFLVLLAQLWRLQVIEVRQYRDYADNNRLDLQDVRAPRGVIYDRHRVPLVRNVASFSAAIIPATLPKQQRQIVVERLAALLEMPGEEITAELDELLGRQDPFIPISIKRNIDRTVAFTLEEQHERLPGVVALAEPIRQYPFGALLSHVLGYMGRISAEEYAKREDEGYKVNDELGKSGVEATFESRLRGKEGKELLEVDVSRRKIRTIDSRPARPGNNLVLTIDVDLQRHVAQFLEEGRDSSPYSAAVVLDPRSGEILALVSLPSYDNNLFSGGISRADLDRLMQDESRPLFNYAIGGVYPPGSTFKVITGAAALQEAVATPQTRIQSRGFIQVRSEYDPRVVYTFRDWSSLGWLDFYQGLSQSSDVYFYYLGGGFEGFAGLGIDRLAAYSHRFGIGEPTNIDLLGESDGLMPDPVWKRRVKKEAWTVADTYFASIGQGDVLTTPLQMANVAAAIANGGTLYKPQIVREVLDERGQAIQRFEPEVLQTVGVSPENLRAVQQGMLEGVRTGLAKNAQVPGFEVAGKTGTAEYGVIDPRTGQQRTHAWFIGYAPQEAPRIALAVFQYNGSGSQHATPVAQRIFEYFLRRG